MEKTVANSPKLNDERYSDISTKYRAILINRLSFSTDSYAKLIDLSDVSCQKEVLDRVIEDAQYLVEKAREERQVLDFYLTKIRAL